MRRYVTQKKISGWDILVLLFVIIGAVCVFRGRDWYALRPAGELALVNPYLVKADTLGNTWVIDQERSRVVKIDGNGQVRYTLQSTLREADTFWYAEDLAFAPDGTAFLLDASWDESGSAVGRECILAYSPDGRYADTLSDITYEDDMPDKHRLFALHYREGALYYVESGEEGFSVFRIFTDTKETEEIAFYSYENAFNLIQDYGLGQDGETVYALDKRGRILKGSGGALNVLYDTRADAEQTGRTAFYRIAADAQGFVYVTDIRQNILFRFDEKAGTLEEYVNQGQVLGVSAVSLADGSTALGFQLDAGIVMRNVTTGRELAGEVFPKCASLRLRETAYQALAVLAFLGALWLAVRLFVLLRGIKTTEVQKDGILAAGTTAVVSAIIVSQLLSQFASVYREELVNRLYTMAYTISGMMDAESVERIRAAEDYMGEDYRRLMDVLALGMNKEDVSVKEMYCNVLRYEDGRGYAIAYLDNSIGTYYPRDESDTQDLIRIYETGEVIRNDGKDDATGSYIYVCAPVLDKQGRVAGVVEVGTTANVITGKIEEMRRSVMIMLVMVVLLVLFLFGEALSFFDMRARFREAKRSGKPRMPLHMLRCSVFITFMAFNVASSFLPVYAAGFVTGALGIPQELAASLPITLNLIFVGVTSLFCARLLLRFSFRTVAAVSACICMAGDAMMFFGHAYVWIVVGLILNGTGVGLITNSVNMFIAGISDETEREDGFSLFNAGCLSGTNCGMMLGASLAGMMGQRMVFLCSSVTWGLVAVLFSFMGKHMKGMQQEARRKNTWKFLASRGVLPYLLLVLLPYVVINSFVFYYVPIYGNTQGFSENIVCLLLMLNSLCSVYMSVAVTNFVNRKMGEWSIYLSSVLSFAGLLLFGWKSTVSILVFVLLLLGLASSFGSSVRQLYFTKLPGVDEYGEEDAMGIYNFMDSVGGSAGPMLFGGIMAGTGVFVGLLGFVAASGAMNALYAAIFRRRS